MLPSRYSCGVAAPISPCFGTTSIAPVGCTSIALPSSSCGPCGLGSAALALDAADGVIDGKFFGQRIMGEVSTVCTSYVPPTPVCAPVDVTVMTNVPPLGNQCVSVVECGPAPAHAIPPPPPPPAFQHTESHTMVKRQLPGAAEIAAEFHDLRAMLERDRQQFEYSRQEFERSIAEREMRLKTEQEKLNVEWGRFRTEESSFKEMQSGKLAEIEEALRKTRRDVIFVKTMKEAQELDVKDGIIDGKFNGRQIEIEGQGPLIPPAHLMGKRVGPPPPVHGKGLIPPGKGAGKGTYKGGPGSNVVLPPGTPPKFTLGQAPQLAPPGTLSPAGGKGMMGPGKGMGKGKGKGKGM